MPRVPCHRRPERGGRKPRGEETGSTTRREEVGSDRVNGNSPSIFSYAQRGERGKEEAEKKRESQNKSDAQEQARQVYEERKESSSEKRWKIAE